MPEAPEIVISDNGLHLTNEPKNSWQYISIKGKLPLGVFSYHEIPCLVGPLRLFFRQPVNPDLGTIQFHF
jgi:hypothetical protein